MGLSIYNNIYTMFGCQNFIKKIVLFLLVIGSCFSNSALSQNSLKGTEIVGNAIVTTPVDENVGKVNIRISNPETFVRLKVDDDLPHEESFIYTITLNVTPFLADGTPDTSYEQELNITYNINGEVPPYTDLSYHGITNRYGVSITVASINVINPDNNSIINGTPGNIILETGFTADILQKLSDQEPQFTLITITENTLNLSWDEIVGAQEYELEWTWIDNYGTNANGVSDINAVKQANTIPFSERDFELNNTRILIKTNSYTIPLIYDRGYVLYRLRAIGRFMTNTDKLYYGKWSKSSIQKEFVSNWDFQEIGAHENNKNWQFQASYAEDGKSKEVVSYFDGTLRNRQTVTKINSDDKPIVGEVIYDNQGRPAIEVLPTPVADEDGNAIKYYDNFNLVNTNTPYTNRDFDWDAKNANECEVEVVGMTAQSGASRYYSPNGDKDPNKPYQDFVSDAKQFPFSQIEYTPDNTGRIARKGGVGDTHQLGTGHEMKYFYLQPTQEELNRIFGYNVGDKKRYKKNMVVDPNGQVSISYIDPQGRTIATALTGKAPGELLALPDQANKTDDMFFDLLNKVDQNDVKKPEDNNEYFSTGRFGNDVVDGLVFSYPLGVSEDNSIFQFTYSMGTANPYTEDCLPLPYDFKYDLEITLVDDCNDNKFEDALPTNNDVLYDNIISFSEITKNTVPLNVGSYQLNKRIKVNEASVNEYVEKYLDDYTCRLNIEDFNPSVSIDDCFTSCQDCVDSLLNRQFVEEGEDPLYPSEEELKLPRQQYVIEQISQVMGNDTFLYDNNGELTSIMPTDITDSVLYDARVDLYEQRFKDEFDLLLAACQAPCNLLSVCEINETSLLADVSPMGQYGGDIKQEDFEDGIDNDTGFDELSVFNENNVLGDTHNWKNPSPDRYRDASGEISKIYLRANSDLQYTGNPTTDIISDEPYIFPEQLINVEDFLERWQDSWAKSLVIYHPEQCYLDFFQALCAKTLDIGTGTPFNSDTYDTFITSKLETLKDALGGNGAFTVNVLTGKTSLMDNDPYFEGIYPGIDTNITGYNTAEVRKQIMLEAMNSKYTSITDENGVLQELSMLKMAYLTVVYGSALSLDLSNLTIPRDEDIITQLAIEGPSSLEGIVFAQSQKERVWTTYKFYYIGLKKKIISVFSNIYAKQQGCFNGCIGEGGNPSVVGALQDYSQFPQLWSMFDAGLNTLCTSSAAPYLKEKKKRFIPIDNLYDSGVSTIDAANGPGSETDFQIWSQTGKCPLAYDMEYFLNGLAEDGALVSDIPIRQINYLVPDLYKALTTGVAINDNVMVNNQVVNSQTLEIGFSGIEGCKTSLVLPDNTLNWNNYASDGITGWKLLSFSGFAYDLNSYDSTNKTFAFSVVANIIPDGIAAPENEENLPPLGILKQYVLTGVTCAPIGECGVTEGAIGEVLSNQVSIDGGNGCRKRDRFQRSLLGLMNELNTSVVGSQSRLLGSMLTDVNTYTESILPVFLGDHAELAKWELVNSSSFALKLGNRDILTIRNLYDDKVGTNFNFTTGNEVKTFLGIKIHGENRIELRLVDQNNEIRDIKGRIYEANNTNLDFTCECNNEQIFSRNEFLIDKLNAVINYVHNNFDDIPEGYVPNALTDLGKYLDLPTGVVLGIFDKSKNDPYEYYLAKDNVGNPIYKVAVNGTNPFGLQHLRLDKNTYVFADDIMKLNVNGLPISDETASIDSITFNNDNFCEVESSGDLGQDSNCPNIEGTSGTDQRTMQFFNILSDVFRWGQSFGGAEGYTSQDIRSFFHYYDNPKVEQYSSSVNSSDFSLTFMEFYISGDNTLPRCKISFTLDSGLIFTTGEVTSLSGLQIQFVTVDLSPSNSTIQASDFSITLAGSSLVRGNGTVSCSVCSDSSEDVSCSPIKICEAEELCIPQVVAPVACNEKYNDFIGKINIQIPDYQIPFYLLNDPDATNDVDRYRGEDYFCKLNYQYITDSYLEYLSAMGVNSVEHAEYLTIGGFGETDLNYGFEGISTVITEFAHFVNDLGYDLGWQNFVNVTYLSGNPVCPPAPLIVEVDIPIDDDTDNEECRQYLLDISGTYSQDEYDNYLRKLKAAFKQNYVKEAVDNLVESFTMTAPDREYQYTLYYYDQAGNLVQTVPPEGVDRPTDVLDPAQQSVYNANVNKDRTKVYRDTDEVNSTLPDHTLQTQYRYNSLNQLVWQKTPDGGITRFAYDGLGRIIASQNNKQKNLDAGLRFSYTNYDVLGRIIEAGEFIANANIYIDDFGKLKTPGGNNIDSSISYPNQIAVEKAEVTKTIYDELLATEIASVFENYDSSTSRNRVTSVLYFDNYAGDDFGYQNAILYNYDIHGNVKELVVDNRDPEMVAINQNMKHVNYEYDLISGNVNQVIFQKRKPDQFMHKYSYDADNRIIAVETSSDGVIWEQDASYEYYAHGSLARTVIGDKEVQGMDYAYTLQGWLKGVNSEAVGQNDIGKDGGSFNKVAKDALAYSLNYYKGDYTARSTSSPFTKAETGAQVNTKDLFNGNIKTMVTSLLDNKESALSVLQNNYTYDQLNRIKTMNSYDDSGSSAYTASYSYDNNGNLKTLDRTIAGTDMDKLIYSYADGTNQLLTVKDNANDAVLKAAYGEINDLKDQFTYLNIDAVDTADKELKTTHNYIYDDIGQLIEDKSEGLLIDWRVDGKVKSVTKQDGTVITFTYDGLGNRIGKTEDRPDTNENGEFKDNIVKTLYSRDAQGNVLAVYGTSTVPLDNGDSCDIDVFLNGEVVTMVETEKAIENITISNTADYLVTETGNVTMTAGKSVSWKPGFHAKTGSDVLAQIALVDCEPTQEEEILMGLSLKEHHIYGSSRLGLQESDLVLGDSNAAPGSMARAVINKINSTKNLNSGAVFKTSGLPASDFALNFSVGNAVSGVWKDSYWFSKPTNGSDAFYQLSLKLNIIDAPVNDEEHIVSTNGKYFPDIGDPNSKVFDLQASMSVIKKSDGLLYPIAKVRKQEEGESKVYSYKVQSTRGFSSGSRDITVQFDPETNLIQLFTNGRLTPVSVLDNGSSIGETISYLEGLDNIISNIDPNADTQTINFNICYLAYGAITNSSFSNVAFNFSEGSGETVVSDSGDKSIRVVNFDSSDAWVANGCQTNDTDNDGITNNDEYDADNDGIGDENTPDDTDGDGIPNYLDPDDDNDSVLTFDEVPGTDDNIPNHLDTDDDNDGVLTINELATQDTDSDGTLNYLDPDDDGDGLLTLYEGAIANTDQDAVPNYLDDDDDGDGVLTIYEGANPDGDGNPATGNTLNTDGDSLFNYLDDDDDGDGYATYEENPDPNGDGNPADAINTDVTEDTIPDYLDDTHSILPPTAPIASTDLDRVVGDKRYELSNHLGNVMSVVSDRKISEVGETNELSLLRYDFDDWISIDQDSNWSGDKDTDVVTVVNGQLESPTGIAFLIPTEAGKTYKVSYDIEITAAFPIGHYMVKNQNTGRTLTTGVFSENGRQEITLVADGTVSRIGWELITRTGQITDVFRLDNVIVNEILENPIPLVTFTPDVLTYSDYYPFGMLLPNRHSNSSEYRYGFNGKESDNEVKGEGVQYDYGFRIYDARLGKFLSTDPLSSTFPWYTPYQFSGNTPIQAIDLDGLEEYHYLFTIDHQGNSKITLETVEDIVEKEWSWSKFKFVPQINEFEKHVVHYRPELLVVIEGHGIMSEQDFTETFDNEEGALNTIFDDFEDDFNRFELITSIANGAAFRGNTRSMRRTFKNKKLDAKAQPNSLLKNVRSFRNFTKIEHTIESKSFFGQSVLFKAKMAIREKIMVIKGISMFRKGSITWSDPKLVGKMGREIIQFKSKMIKEARDKGVKTLVLEFLRTGEGSTKRERAMIIEVDVQTGKTIRTEEISVSQYMKNQKKE